MESIYDTIILGLGAMGSAAAYQLAKRNNRILGIDQYSPPHVYGSTHGDTRQTRKALGDGHEYILLNLRSYEIWKQIEEETGKSLIQINGMLIISSKSGNYLKRLIETAKKYNIRHDVIDATEIRSRFPQFNVNDDEAGYYEYDGAFLRPEECIKANLMLAEKYGAQIHLNEKVVNFQEVNGLVHVKTDRKEYVAKKLIVSAGAWLPSILGDEFKHIFVIKRQLMFWFDVKNCQIENYVPEKFPMFSIEFSGKSISLYGFPSINGPDGGVKVGIESPNGGVEVASLPYTSITTPDSVKREVTEHEIKEMYENYVKSYIPGLTEKCIKAASCLYTCTPDWGFIIDKHPKYENVILASPCSGHGFKHSAAIGETLAELITEGKTTIDISGFTISRFFK